jgi:hypothetical protein
MWPTGVARHASVRAVVPVPASVPTPVWKAPAGLPVGVQNLDLLQWDDGAKQWVSNRVTDGGNF